MSDVTCLLEAAAAGDRKAAAELLPLVYDELRKLAAVRMAAESPDQTLQATALVHEAYLRLVGPAEGSRWDNRGHFFAAAAEAMRRILVESARRRNADKRGGRRERISLSEAELAAPELDQVLAIDDALDELARVDADAATLVKLRFFVGLPAAEAATAMGMSVRSAHDLWAYARAWLSRRLRPE